MVFFILLDHPIILKPEKTRRTFLPPRELQRHCISEDIRTTRRPSVDDVTMEVCRELYKERAPSTDFVQLNIPNPHKI